MSGLPKSTLMGNGLLTRAHGRALLEVEKQAGNVFVWLCLQVQIGHRGKPVRCRKQSLEPARVCCRHMGVGWVSSVCTCVYMYVQVLCVCVCMPVCVCV